MKKINWLLIMQAWAMLWVVIGHAPLLDTMGGGGNLLYVNYLAKIAYSFHMALFIFVSGWLFCTTRIESKKKEWKWQDIMKDKLLRLGLPMVVFTFASMLLKVMFPGDMARQSAFSLSEFVYAILCPVNGPAREMWFIAVLMLCFLLTPIWKWSLGNSRKESALAAIILCLHFMRIDIEWFSIGYFTTYAIFFYTGILAFKHRWLEKINGKILLTALLGLMLMIAGLSLREANFAFSNYLLSATGGILVSASIAFTLDKFCPKVFFSFRDYTYQIFLMGIFFQIFVKMIYKRIDMPYSIGFLACILIGIYMPVIVSKIFEKINWSPLLLCIGLKKKENRK